MAQSLDVLKHRAHKMGMSIRKNRGSGYSLIIDEINSVWHGFDGDPENLDLEALEYWLGELESQKEGI